MGIVLTEGAANALLREGPVAYLEKWGRMRFPFRLLRSIQGKASLELTLMPPAVPHAPDPGRDVLAREWQKFASGLATAQEAIDSLSDVNPRSGDPLIRHGLYMLHKYLSRGDMLTQRRSNALEELSGWVHSAERYDREPLAWHESYALRSLSTDLKFSSDIRGLTSRYESLVDRDDVDALIRGMGRRALDE